MLALPVQLAGEFVGELLWNNKASRLVEQKTAAKSFSPLRICYGLVLLLLFAGLLLGVGYEWRVLRPHLGMHQPKLPLLAQPGRSAKLSRMPGRKASSGRDRPVPTRSGRNIDAMEPFSK